MKEEGYDFDLNIRAGFQGSENNEDNVNKGISVRQDIIIAAGIKLNCLLKRRLFKLLQK